MKKSHPVDQYKPSSRMDSPNILSPSQPLQGSSKSQLEAKTTAGNNSVFSKVLSSHNSNGVQGLQKMEGSIHPSPSNRICEEAMGIELLFEHGGNQISASNVDCGRDVDRCRSPSHERSRSPRHYCGDSSEMGGGAKPPSNKVGS